MSMSLSTVYLILYWQKHSVENRYLENNSYSMIGFFQDDDNKPPKGVLTILPIMLSSVIMALLCYTGPELLASMAVPFKMNIEDGIFFGFLALLTASLMFPRMVAR